MSYELSLRKEFLKCNTQIEVDEIGMDYLYKIYNWSDGIKGILMFGAAGVCAYQMLKNRGYITGDNLPNVPFADKFGHFAKGMFTSVATGWLHEWIDDKLEKPEDADDVIRNYKKHIFERAVLEGSMTIAEAFGWEYLQMSSLMPSQFGGVFDMNDVFADFAGHLTNWGITAYYSRKMVILYNQIMKRKSELNDSGLSLSEYEIPEPIDVKKAPITMPRRYRKSLEERLFGEEKAKDVKKKIF